MKRLRYGLCVASLAGPLQARSPQEEGRLARLLDLHVRWLGGQEALAELTSLSLAGTLDASGLSGALQVEQTAEGWSRVHYDLKVVSRTMVVGPEGDFSVNASGQIEPMPEAEIAQMRFENLRAFGRHFSPQPDVRVSLLPEEEKDGRRFSVVRFERGGGPPHDLFLDPSDGSTVWTRNREDTETVWTRLEDWRPVQGLRFPHRQRTFRRIESTNAQITWTEIRVNPEIDRARFSRPSASRDRFKIRADGRSTGWLPVSLYLERWGYLRGKLNGHETDMVLDSGAGMTVVDASFAKSIGLEGRGTVAAVGAGGRQEASFAPGLSLEVGPLTLREVQGVVIDLSGVERMLGRTMPVILGKEVFHELVVDLDYPRSRVAFHAPESFEYEGNGTTVELIADGGGQRLVEASAEGLPPARFSLDTGSGGTVNFFRAFTEQHELLDGRRSSEARGGGVGGSIVNKAAMLRSFRFAGYELQQVPAQFTVEGGNQGAFDTEEKAGNLGVGILGRFRLIFDYSRERLHVEPGPDWKTRPFPKDRLGLSGDFEAGAVVVRFVAPESPAAGAGWQVGERIAAVDGTQVLGTNWAEVMARLSKIPAGTEVVFTDEKGNERRLVSADYY